MPVEIRVLDNPHPVDQNNVSRRLLLLFCLDVSGSMRKNVKDLEKGILRFIEDCYDHLETRKSCEIMIITFGESVNVIQQFDTVDCIVKNGLPQYNLNASGYTPIGESVRLGLELLDERWEELKHLGFSRYIPCLVVMSDGYPEGSTPQVTAERMAVLDEVSQELAKRVIHKTLTTFSIGIGKYNNEKVMDKLSPGRKSVHLQSYADGRPKFDEFFSSLSSSLFYRPIVSSQRCVNQKTFESCTESWENTNSTINSQEN